MGQREFMIERTWFPCGGVMAGGALICEVSRRAFSSMAPHAMGGTDCGMVHNGSLPTDSRVLMAVGAVTRVMAGWTFAFMACGTGG